jgi:TRAP-type C4-dicarboxylate transport system substrate-binding protein
MLRILPAGNVVQATLLYPGYVSRDAPDLAFAMPNEALGTWEEYIKIVPSLADIYSKTYEKHGIKYLNSVLIPPRGIYFFCKQPVTSLDELRKRKMRAWTKSLADTYNKLGVAATVIPQAEMYLALQTGVVDCATYTLDAVNTISMHEVAPHGARIAAYGGPINLVTSKRAWDALSKDMQAIVQEEADKVYAESLDDYKNGTTENREAQKFLAAGGKLSELSQKDRDEYLKAAREIWTAATAQLGGATKQNAERIAKELGW